MATIRKRKNKWQVVVRRKGFPPVAKTLIKYSDAKKFANELDFFILGFYVIGIIR